MSDIETLGIKHRHCTAWWRFRSCNERNLGIFTVTIVELWWDPNRCAWSHRTL